MEDHLTRWMVPIKVAIHPPRDLFLCRSSHFQHCCKFLVGVHESSFLLLSLVDFPLTDSTRNSSNEHSHPVQLLTQLAVLGDEVRLDVLLWVLEWLKKLLELLILGEASPLLLSPAVQLDKARAQLLVSRKTVSTLNELQEHGSRI